MAASLEFSSAAEFKQQQVTMSRNQAAMISRNRRFHSNSSSSCLHRLRTGEELQQEGDADGNGLLDVEEGETFMGLVGEMEGAKTCSSVASSGVAQIPRTR